MNATAKTIPCARTDTTTATQRSVRCGRNVIPQATTGLPRTPPECPSHPLAQGIARPAHPERTSSAGELRSRPLLVTSAHRRLALALAATLGACELPPDRLASDSGPEEVVPDAGIPDDVDLLFLIDDSGSMALAQGGLTSCFGGVGAPIIFEQIDLDGDGIPDREAVGDAHVGFISTDMGSGGYRQQTCHEPAAGDDGLLQRYPSGNVAGCDESYPLYLEWRSGDDLGVLQQDFACLATLGTSGCGFEQHFASLRRALVDHANGANRGFLRDDSMLAIVIQSDEDDGTVRPDPQSRRIFDPDATDLGPTNLRAFLHPELLVPPDEIARQLAAVRSDPSHLVIGARVGVPVSSDTDCRLAPPADLDCLLAEPSMAVAIDDSPQGKGERLRPSCDGMGTGEGFPARRILEVLRELQRGGAQVAVRSICEVDPQFLFRDLAPLLADPLPRADR